LQDRERPAVHGLSVHRLCRGFLCARTNMAVRTSAVAPQMPTRRKPTIRP
jgi:hypothetical protein